MRLVVITAVERHIAEPSWLGRLERLDGAVEPQNACENLRREADVFPELPPASASVSTRTYES
jgi:hypothetical protein